MAIDHKISRSEFISDRFVLLLIERYRIKMCYGQMLFFSYKNAHITYLAFHSKPPIRKITLACVACLCFVCVVVAQSKTARGGFSSCAQNRQVESPIKFSSIVFSPKEQNIVWRIH